jgi:hypothetical protein
MWLHLMGERSRHSSVTMLCEDESEANACLKFIFAPPQEMIFRA